MDIKYCGKEVSRVQLGSEIKELDDKARMEIGQMFAGTYFCDCSGTELHCGLPFIWKKGLFEFFSGTGGFS